MRSARSLAISRYLTAICLSFDAMHNGQFYSDLCRQIITGHSTRQREFAGRSLSTSSPGVPSVRAHRTTRIHTLLDLNPLDRRHMTVMYTHGSATLDSVT